MQICKNPFFIAKSSYLAKKAPNMTNFTFLKSPYPKANSNMRKYLQNFQTLNVYLGEIKILQILFKGVCAKFLYRTNAICFLWLGFLKPYKVLKSNDWK